jgi:hypothetical protein
MLCGDINYLECNNRKVNLVEMLKATVYFPTRITENLATLITYLLINEEDIMLNHILMGSLIMMLS